MWRHLAWLAAFTFSSLPPASFVLLVVWAFCFAPPDFGVAWALVLAWLPPLLFLDMSKGAPPWHNFDSQNNFSHVSAFFQSSAGCNHTTCFEYCLEWSSVGNLPSRLSSMKENISTLLPPWFAIQSTQDWLDFDNLSLGFPSVCFVASTFLRCLIWLIVDALDGAVMSRTHQWLWRRTLWILLSRDALSFRRTKWTVPWLRSLPRMTQSC